MKNLFQNISDKKQRQILEKITFHELLNPAGGLKSAGELMGLSGPKEFCEMRGLLATLRPCAAGGFNFWLLNDGYSVTCHIFQRPSCCLNDIYNCFSILGGIILGCHVNI